MKHTLGKFIHLFKRAVKMETPNGASRFLEVLTILFMSVMLVVVSAHAAESQSNTPYLIDLSEKYDSRILPICEYQKLGHQGGTAIGDINGDGINDLLLSAYNSRVARSKIVDSPPDKDSWTESSNLSLWAAPRGIYSISASPYSVAGNSSIVGIRNSSKNAVFRIKWDNSINLKGCDSLNMYINVSNRTERLIKVRIFSPTSDNGTIYKEVIDLEKCTWTEITINSTDFKKVGSQKLSNISFMDLVFSGGIKDDEIKIDELYFEFNKTVFSIGAIYVFFGPISGIYNTSGANVTIFGTNDTNLFGDCISVGNINNDTYDDIIVGSPGQHYAKKEIKFDGKIQVFFGGPQISDVIDAKYEANFSIYGKNQSCLGYNIVSKDINNNFIDDLIFSAPLADGKSYATSYNCGEIYIIYGSSELSDSIDLKDSEPDITIIGKDKWDKIGRQSTFDIGNIYGDGVKDLIIGVKNGDSVANNRKDAGEVYIINNISSYNGTINLNDINITTTIYGAEAGDLLGKLTVSDFNNDGLDDVLMGAPRADGVDNGRKDSGEVYIIYGRHHLSSIIDLNLSKIDVRIVGADSHDHLGDVVASGDVSRDTFPDIILGSPLGDWLYDNKTNCGEVNILFSNNKNISGLIDLRTFFSDITLYGADPNDNLRDLYIGNISGDNVSDLIIGFRDADGLNNTKKDGGEVFVINGETISKGSQRFRDM